MPFVDPRIQDAVNHCDDKNLALSLGFIEINRNDLQLNWCRPDADTFLCKDGKTVTEEEAIRVNNKTFDQITVVHKEVRTNVMKTFEDKNPNLISEASKQAYIETGDPINITLQACQFDAFLKANAEALFAVELITVLENPTVSNCVKGKLDYKEILHATTYQGPESEPLSTVLHTASDLKTYLELPKKYGESADIGLTTEIIDSIDFDKNSVIVLQIANATEEKSPSFDKACIDEIIEISSSLCIDKPSSASSLWNWTMITVPKGEYTVSHTVKEVACLSTP